MKRTNSRRRRQSIQFCKDNRRLFPFVGLFILGVVLGVATYVTTDRDTAWGWDSLLQVTAVNGGLRSGLNALWGACFSTVALLAALYLLGLWACGAPVILLVPVFHGMGLGMTEAHYYAMGGSGVVAVVTVILPVGLLTAAVLVMACAESLRLCTGIAQRLLPQGETETAPGMWETFRLYSLRFLLFLVAAFGTGLVEILLRTVLGGLLPG